MRKWDLYEITKMLDAMIGGTVPVADSTIDSIVKDNVEVMTSVIAQPEITNEEIRFALKQLLAYFAIKIRDGKEGSIPVELSQRVEEIQKYFENVPSAQPEQGEMIKEIRKWINSGNRGKADYFIVDKIEEIINKYE